MIQNKSTSSLSSFNNEAQLQYTYDVLCKQYNQIQQLPQQKYSISIKNSNKRKTHAISKICAHQINSNMNQLTLGQIGSQQRNNNFQSQQMQQFSSFISFQDNHAIAMNKTATNKGKRKQKDQKNKKQEKIKNNRSDNSQQININTQLHNTIKQLTEQISILKQQNHNLITQNSQLSSELFEFKYLNQQLTQKLYFKQQIQQTNYQSIKTNRKQRIENLLKQIAKIKQNTNKLRIKQQENEQCISKLKKKLQFYDQKQTDWKWKNRFIEVFVDMLHKISGGIHKEWSEKKKIHIGWKVVKYIVDKAILNGVKCPKVETKKFKQMRDSELFK